MRDMLVIKFRQFECGHPYLVRVGALQVVLCIIQLIGVLSGADSSFCSWAVVFLPSILCGGFYAFMKTLDILCKHF